jgi:Fe2+ transport system protein FeoA
MGFCENALIRTLRKGEHSIICELFNTRIGLNRELASAIVIAPPGS